MIEENHPPESNALLTHDEANVLPRIGGIHTININVSESTISPENGEFNPFEDRKMDNTTTDCQTLSHLLKSTLGSGILAMPYAFKHAGIVGGMLGGLFVASVCTHTSYVLADCAHVLYYKTKKKTMDYPDVVEAAFASGPERTQKFSKIARNIVQISIFVTYFGACSADNLIIAMNYGQVIRYYMSESSNNATVAAELANVPLDNTLLRSIMGILIVPLILFVWVPDLKYLAPISTLANFFMAAVIGITFYYVVQDPLPLSELSFTQPLVEFPQFFAVTLFAMENIGVIMPLENNMKTPQNFLGTCGVINRGMFIVTFVYLILGVSGYIKYGDNVSAIITASLPVTDVAAQLVKVLIGSTILFTFSLQFYVCRDMAWNCIKHHFPKYPLLAEYLLRGVLVIICVSIAIALPKIGLLVNVVGALGFSLLGIVGPALVQTITHWEIGYGRFHWRLYKNISLILLGISAILFGTCYAIMDIINML